MYVSFIRISVSIHLFYTSCCNYSGIALCCQVHQQYHIMTTPFGFTYNKWQTNQQICMNSRSFTPFDELHVLRLIFKIHYEKPTQKRARLANNVKYQNGTTRTQNYMDENKNGRQFSNKFAQKEVKGESQRQIHTHTHTMSLHTQNVKLPLVLFVSQYICHLVGRARATSAFFRFHLSLFLSIYLSI